MAKIDLNGQYFDVLISNNTYNTYILRAWRTLYHHAAISQKHPLYGKPHQPISDGSSVGNTKLLYNFSKYKRFTDKQKKQYYDFFMALQNVLPCGVCRKNLKNDAKLLNIFLFRQSNDEK